MCGLTGWFTAEKVDKESDSLCIRRMMNAISHRGPDGQGVLIKENAVLGHVRLSIIDIESGSQPMSYHDKDIHIIFNGEIYNYKELRKNLSQEGFIFKTNSDTEVILAMYVKHGLEAFQYLRGMFAIAIWDENKKRGVLVRDPIGIKPLFYKVSRSNELVFASEAKGILAKSNLNRKLDIYSLHFLMNFRYLPNEQTMFQGIKQLSPGEIIEWSYNKPIKKHSFKFLNKNSDLSILESIKESVRIHLTSDVEVGAYLSGGIDSACISKFANESTAKKLRTFTLNTGDDPNEAVNAKSTALLLGVENIVGDDISSVEELLPKLVWHLEVPKVNALQANQVAKLASSKVKVVMSGLGGDELFLGYNAHKIMLAASQLDCYTPRKLSNFFSGACLSFIKKLDLPLWSEQERAAQMLGNMGHWSRVYGILRNVWDEGLLRQKVYGPRMLDANLPNAFSYLDAEWPDNDDPVGAAAEFEWRHKMVNDLLWQEDRCSMAEGLEVRVPFLDLELTERIRKIPRSELIKGGQAKVFMKNILKDTLPKEILSRPKSGFQVDASAFFKNNLTGLANKYLNTDKVIEYGLFNPEFVTEIKNYRIGKSTRWHFFMLYMMIMTHLWVEVFEKENTEFQFLNIN